jgi:3-oxoacyl-[acyl-carrier protein] reductase
MDLGIVGKRALVLGASRGLGRAVAAALVAEGAQVAIVSRDPDRLQQTARDIGAALALPADLDQPGATRAVVQAVIAQWGGIDILVTNTGGPAKAAFSQVTREAWLGGFEALWLSAVDGIQAALPGMIERRWGRILLVTSVAAQEPMVGLTVSNGLRAGLLNLGKSLSDEVAQHGVTVNSLLPGYTATERMVELGVTDAQIATQVPARRMGTSEEFGALAAFLASQPAGYITGQAIACDGGWLRGH